MGILCLALLLAGCHQTYQDEKVAQELAAICKTEYGINNIQVKLSGKTIGVFLPLKKLFSTNFKEALSLTKLQNVESLLQPSQEALDQVEDVLFSTSRVVLSTDKQINFYVLYATDVDATGLQLVLMGNVNDIKRVRLWDIARSEYRKRVLHDLRLNRTIIWSKPVAQLFQAIGKKPVDQILSEYFTASIDSESISSLFHSVLTESEHKSNVAYELLDIRSQNAQAGEALVYVKAKETYQIKAGEKLMEGDLKLGHEIQTGWMDFKFKVDEYYPHAQMRKDFAVLPTSSQSIEAIPVILVELSSPSPLPSPSGRGQGEGKKTIWLEQGEISHVALGGSDYHVLYGLKTKPLGFQIELRDFVIETDPGTNKPASFKSLIRLKDPSTGIDREQMIQMNEPLKYRGFKVYQSAYQQNPGEADISIFTVARDPGNGLKYAGALIMIAGIGMLFYVKSLSTLKSSDPKLRSK